MPKIIDNVMDMVVTYSKKVLLSKGYHALTMREIATACNIAPGTVYNYFESKDELIAGIMLEDWLIEVKKATISCKRARSSVSGFSSIFNAIRSFTMIYKDVFADYGNIPGDFNQYHEKLSNQIEKLVQIVIERYGTGSTPDPTHFISELLLRGGLDFTVDFEDMSPFLEKII